MLSVLVLEGSDVAAEDVARDDLVSATSSGMLFLDSDLVVAGVVDDMPTVVDLASAIDPVEDLLPIAAASSAACSRPWART